MISSFAGTFAEADTMNINGNANTIITTEADSNAEINTYALDSDNISFSIPTTVPCLMKADGTVISPSNWEIKNTGSKEIKLSNVSMTNVSYGFDTHLYEGSDNTGKELVSLFYSHPKIVNDVILSKNETKTCRWWCTGIDAYFRHNADRKIHVANVAFTFKCNEPTEFAIYSDDDKSLDFYKRIDVPEIGDTFNGKKVTAVYTGLTGYHAEENMNGIPTTPWTNYRNIITNVDIVDRIMPSSISYWFQWCTKVIEFKHLDNIDTSKLHEIVHTFYQCDSVKELDCSSWDVSNVTNFDQIFGTCKSLKTVNIHTWDTSNADLFLYLFNDDFNLTKIIGLEEIRLPVCRQINNMFNNCSSLESLDLSSLNISENCITNVALNAMHSLQEIKICTTWTWKYGYEGEYYVQTINSPSDFIKCIDGYGCWYDTSDGKGYLPSEMPQHHATTYKAVKPCFAVYSADDGSLDFYKRFDELQEGGAIDGKTATHVYDSGIECSDFETVAENVNSDFPRLPWLDEINNIRSVKVVDGGIHPKAVSNWFYCMQNLTSIDISLLDTSRCTDFRSFFNACSSIEELDLSNIDMSQMADGRNMYVGCEKLNRISVNDPFRYGTITDPVSYYYLPAPNESYIDGADGKWYDEESGEGYAPEDVPQGRKATYVASNKLLSNVSLQLDANTGNVLLDEST